VQYQLGSTKIGTKQLHDIPQKQKLKPRELVNNSVGHRKLPISLVLFNNSTRQIPWKRNPEQSGEGTGTDLNAVPARHAPQIRKVTNHRMPKELAPPKSMPKTGLDGMGAAVTLSCGTAAALGARADLTTREISQSHWVGLEHRVWVGDGAREQPGRGGDWEEEGEGLTGAGGQGPAAAQQRAFERRGAAAGWAGR
jgi:hypothetical protein